MGVKREREFLEFLELEFHASKCVKGHPSDNFEVNDDENCNAYTAYRKFMSWNYSMYVFESRLRLKMYYLWLVDLSVMKV